MKKYIQQTLAVLFVLSLLFTGSVSAQGMMGQYYDNGPRVIPVTQTQNTNINNAIKDISTSQNINDEKQIDCSKVTDSQFEKLGDASMGLGITEEQHKSMENMMGGEGSLTLKQAHINMGRAYLGCWANYQGQPSINSPMMGGQYGVDSRQYSYGNMINWSTMMGGYGLFGGVTMILFWALLVLAIVAIVKWLKDRK